MIRLKKWSYIFLAGMMALMIGGCSLQEESAPVQEKTAPVEKQEKKQETVQAVIYLPTDDAMGVRAKTVTVKKEDAEPTAVVNVMIREELKKSYPVFGKNMRVSSVKVNDGIAFTELNESFFTEGQAGSLEEQLEVAAMVNTLTEFSGIKRVQFLRKGEPITTLNGHLDLSEPLARMNSTIVK